MFRDFAGGPQQRQSSGLVAHCLSFVSFRTPILCESSNKKNLFYTPKSTLARISFGQKEKEAQEGGVQQQQKI